MTENVKVVVLPEAVEQAYKKGYATFEGGEPIERDEAIVRALDGFRDGARYSNHVLPDLRRMSGFRDNGHGTFRSRCKVVTVESPDDRPMEGQLTDSHTVMDVLRTAWVRGAMDSMEGNEQDIPHPDEL